jgi:hypothetical protein
MVFSRAAKAKTVGAMCAHSVILYLPESQKSAGATLATYKAHNCISCMAAIEDIRQEYQAARTPALQATSGFRLEIFKCSIGFLLSL